MNILDRALINLKNKMTRAGESIKSFMTEEHGVSTIVATILVLLIVVLLVGVFWEKLSAFVKDLMDRIFGKDPIPEKKF